VRGTHNNVGPNEQLELAQDVGHVFRISFGALTELVPQHAALSIYLDSESEGMLGNQAGSRARY